MSTLPQPLTQAELVPLTPRSTGAPGWSRRCKLNING
jgi:hypothetical protein